MIVATTDGGATWTAEPAPAGIDLAGVSCPAVADCTAVGATATGPAIVSTTDGGAVWAPQAPPAGTYALGSVSCPSVTTCTAVGESVAGGQGVVALSGVVVATTDGGATWVAQTLPSDTLGVGSVSCSSSADCTAVGLTRLGVGQILASDDGGATWIVQVSPTDLIVLYGVSCGPGGCVTVGTGGSLRGVSILRN
ncbi:MAG: WD40/YVTN/BNR-like repeat-containing protein [Acidimicrobiales bacterium]